MITSETGLLDTNVLVYAADKKSPFHESAFALRERGLTREIPVCICPQVLNEFFAIVTDPKRVINPRTQKEALLEVEKYFRSENIPTIHSRPDTFERTLDLLRKYEVTRQEILDVQLVATMLTNKVTRIYTYNRDDFIRFKEIEVLNP
jgi:predicted nucleic acid-binding protein